MDKTTFMSAIVEEVLTVGMEVSYIDLDLQFSSLESIMPMSSNPSISIFRPSDAGTLDAVLSVVKNRNGSSDRSPSGIVVLDSINTLQLLLREHDYKTDSLKANHEAGVLLSLLQDYSIKNSKLLIVTNLIHSRPVTNRGAKRWERDLIGGRMIRSKSDVILVVASNPRDGESGVKRLDVEVGSPDSFLADNSRIGPKFSIEVPSLTLK